MVKRTSLGKYLKKLHFWELLFYVVLIMLMYMLICGNLFRTNDIEGFKDTTDFIIKRGPDIYDEFYGIIISLICKAFYCMTELFQRFNYVKSFYAICIAIQ